MLAAHCSARLCARVRVQCACLDACPHLSTPPRVPGGPIRGARRHGPLNRAPARVRLVGAQSGHSSGLSSFLASAKAAAAAAAACHKAGRWASVSPPSSLDERLGPNGRLASARSTELAPLERRTTHWADEQIGGLLCLLPVTSELVQGDERRRFEEEEENGGKNENESENNNNGPYLGANLALAGPGARARLIGGETCAPWAPRGPLSAARAQRSEQPSRANLGSANQCGGRPDAPPSCWPPSSGRCVTRARAAAAAAAED